MFFINQLSWIKNNFANSNNDLFLFYLIAQDPCFSVLLNSFVISTKNINRLDKNFVNFVGMKMIKTLL